MAFRVVLSFKRKLLHNMTEISQNAGGVVPAFRNKDLQRKKPLTIFTGGTGAGKTALQIVVLRMNPYQKGVNSTSRLPRAGEIHGEHYFFYSRERFEEKIKQNAFIEYEKNFKEEGGQFEYYGLERSVLERIYENGRIPVVTLDVKGARKFIGNTEYQVQIFYFQVSEAEALARLEKDIVQGKRPESDFKKRRKHLLFEIEAASWFDQQPFCEIIPNPDGKFEEAKNLLLKKIHVW